MVSWSIEGVGRLLSETLCSIVEVDGSRVLLAYIAVSDTEIVEETIAKVVSDVTIEVDLSPTNDINVPDMPSVAFVEVTLRDSKFAKLKVELY